jgi:hypothetical protein
MQAVAMTVLNTVQESSRLNFTMEKIYIYSGNSRIDSHTDNTYCTAT